MQKQLRADLVLGTDRKRYTMAIPAFDTVTDHDCLQGGLAIVRAIPEQLTREGAADALALLNMIGKVSGCRKALWALLTPEQKQQVTQLGVIAKGG